MVCCPDKSAVKDDLNKKDSPSEEIHMRQEKKIQFFFKIQD